MKMTKYSGTLSELGNYRSGSESVYDYLIVGDEIIKNVIVRSNLHTKLCTNLGDKIDLHLVGRQLVAITEPDGQMYAYHDPRLPTYSFIYGCFTLFFFFSTWLIVQIDFITAKTGIPAGIVAIPGGLLTIICFLSWCSRFQGAKVQKIIAKELPKNAFMLN